MKEGDKALLKQVNGDDAPVTILASFGDDEVLVSFDDHGFRMVVYRDEVYPREVN